MIIECWIVLIVGGGVVGFSVVWCLCVVGVDDVEFLELVFIIGGML